ncbi:hypothetical protein OKW37_007395 [Paraburkholderia sp. MM5482-R2]
MQLLPMLAEIMSTEAHPLRYPLAFEQFESTLLNALIYGQPNSVGSGMTRERRPLAPFYVRRVEEYIRAHLQEPLTIERLSLTECGLTIHPEKSKILYCKDRSRTQTYPNVTFWS